VCSTRFTTYERIDAARLTVLKSDGTRQEFDRDKLASGLAKALTRRPVADDAAQKAAEEIETALRARGTSEVPSRLIGEMAMAKLRELDQIAYIRFASVYESYEGLEDLRKEVDTLLAEREAEPEPERSGGGGGGGKRYPKR
jgi:transcriptional repressor NrdR